MIVVGLFGQMGSGKGVASKVLQNSFRFLSMGITDPIKAIIRNYLNVPVSALWGDSTERTDTIRKALQEFGDCGRNQDPNIWINYLLKKIKLNYSGSINRIVVDDLRFYEEAQALKGTYNAILIKIESPTSYTGITDSRLKEHNTEKALENTNLQQLIDYTIVNDSTKEEFENKIKQIATRIIDVRKPTRIS